VVHVTRVYAWPAGPTQVRSDIDVRAGEKTVRVTTSFDHRDRDHRIRARFALPRPAETSVAECAFATATRAGAEGGPQEPAAATFPSRRFVSAGGLTVLHRGLLEYELVGGGSALELTLLRATGVIAKPAPPARPVVAGPAVALRDAQMPGPVRFEYALAVGVEDPFALADDLWTPFLTAPAGGAGDLADRGRRLITTGAQVSALHRRAGRIEIRVFNPAADPTTVEVPGHAGDLVDLRGQPVGRWDGRFDLGPWAFATARLDAVTLDPGPGRVEDGPGRVDAADQM
jgi:alpha-mannosidase